MTTHICAYDRAGFGWSDQGPLPRDGRHSAQELATLLERARIPGPYVLVGHSYGKHVVRLFAAAHPDAVAGMVLVDPGHVLDDLAVPAEINATWKAEDATIVAIAPWASRIGLMRLGRGAGQYPRTRRHATGGRRRLLYSQLDHVVLGHGKR